MNTPQNYESLPSCATTPEPTAQKDPQTANLTVCLSLSIAPVGPERPLALLVYWALEHQLAVHKRDLTECLEEGSHDAATQLAAEIDTLTRQLQTIAQAIEGLKGTCNIWDQAGPLLNSSYGYGA